MATDFGTKMLMQDFQKVYIFIFFLVALYGLVALTSQTKN